MPYPTEPTQASSFHTPAAVQAVLWAAGPVVWVAISKSPSLPAPRSSLPAGGRTGSLEAEDSAGTHSLAIVSITCRGPGTQPLLPGPVWTGPGPTAGCLDPHTGPSTHGLRRLGNWRRGKGGRAPGLLPQCPPRAHCPVGGWESGTEQEASMSAVTSTPPPGEVGSPCALLCQQPARVLCALRLCQC